VAALGRPRAQSVGDFERYEADKDGMENSGVLTTSAVAGESYQAASLHHVIEPVSSSRREAPHGESLPIWLAVLVATSCHARSSGTAHAIRWQHVSGRATYTNLGNDEEHIEPLGVRLPRGKTVAVAWLPGETEYTVEVFSKQ
jgi:hypothetical protein